MLTICRPESIDNDPNLKVLSWLCKLDSQVQARLATGDKEKIKNMVDLVSPAYMYICMSLSAYALR